MNRQIPGPWKLSSTPMSISKELSCSVAGDLTQVNTSYPLSFVQYLLILIGVLVDPRDDLKFDPSDRQKAEAFKDLIWYSR